MSRNMTKPSHVHVTCIQSKLIHFICIKKERVHFIKGLGEKYGRVRDIFFLVPITVYIACRLLVPEHFCVAFCNLGDVFMLIQT